MIITLVVDLNYPSVRVITEKPMCTDGDKSRKINLAVKKAGDHQLTVTFNYRYNPVHEAVKRLIANGEIGNGEWQLHGPTITASAMLT